MNALDALQTYAETCLLMHVCRCKFLCQRENAPTWTYKPGIQAMKSSSTRWVPRNWQNAKKGRKEHQKGWNLNPNLYSPACGIRDLSFQPLFCYFLYSKQFWLKSFKCPKERKVGASLYSSTLSPFSDIFREQATIHVASPDATSFSAKEIVPVGHPAIRYALCTCIPTQQHVSWELNTSGKHQISLGWSAHAQKAQCVLSTPHLPARSTLWYPGRPGLHTAGVTGHTHPLCHKC